MKSDKGKGVTVTDINWDDGQKIQLTQGDTATAENLNEDELYGLFFYNSAGADENTPVRVVWSNSEPPQRVIVPGTTEDQGLASVLFVYGGDTTVVSAAVLQGDDGADITAFIGSVKMPIGGGDLNNMELPEDGTPQAFQRFTRFFAVPESHWYNIRIQTQKNQFIVVQFTEAEAQVLVVRQMAEPSRNVQGVGQAKKMFTTKASTTESIETNLQGNGQQIVWINADSVQDSEDAVITLQSM